MTDFVKKKKNKCLATRPILDHVVSYDRTQQDLKLCLIGSPPKIDCVTENQKAEKNMAEFLKDRRKLWQISAIRPKKAT